MPRFGYTARFLKDVKRCKTKHRDMEKLLGVIDALGSNDAELLATRYRDHRLKGRLFAFRELHVERDWLLVYKRTSDGSTIVLTLTRTGSHDDVLG